MKGGVEAYLTNNTHKPNMVRMLREVEYEHGTGNSSGPIIIIDDFFVKFIAFMLEAFLLFVLCVCLLSLIAVFCSVVSIVFHTAARNVCEFIAEFKTRFSK